MNGKKHKLCKSGTKIIANEILKEILDSKLHKDVLKYITPYLSADLTLLEDAMNKSKKKIK